MTGFPLSLGLSLIYTAAKKAYMSIWMIFLDKSFNKGKINMPSTYLLLIFFYYTLFSEKKEKRLYFFQKYNTV